MVFWWQIESQQWYTDFISSFIIIVWLFISACSEHLLAQINRLYIVTHVQPHVSAFYVYFFIFFHYLDLIFQLPCSILRACKLFRILGSEYVYLSCLSSFLPFTIYDYVDSFYVSPLKRLGRDQKTYIIYCTFFVTIL